MQNLVTASNKLGILIPGHEVYDRFPEEQDPRTTVPLDPAARSPYWVNDLLNGNISLVNED